MHTIADLCRDLPHVDAEEIIRAVSAEGMIPVARKLGSDPSTYDNLKLAGRLLMLDLRSKAPLTIEKYVEELSPRLNAGTRDFFLLHKEALQSELDRAAVNDFGFDWFSASTLKTTYLAKPSFDGEPVETPQFLYMRVAVQHYYQVGLEEVISMFRELSAGYYTPASPTLFNCGTINPQLSSCFLLTIDDDLKDILKTGIYQGGMISKSSGGLGFDISRIRHSEIANSGMSHGILPMLQLYNSMVYYVDQGGRRKGAATIYLRPHHLDVEAFVNAVDKQGNRYERVHDLNIALWVPFLFFKRVRDDAEWTLFDPKHSQQLNDVWGPEFERLYQEAEKDPSIEAKYKKVVRARDLYRTIVQMQRRTGMPYILHGDACNMKSNQRHMGYIRCSNLCCEIIEYTDENTIASCNLSSLSLRAFARAKAPSPDSDFDQLRPCYDFPRLASIARSVVRNLNRVIDVNHYPLDKRAPDGSLLKAGKINTSNMKHRPIGMGVSGWAEALHITDLAFEDPAAGRLNEMIFGCLYFNALAETIQLAVKEGTYESFPGSPFSEGKLQFDLWREEFQLKGPNPMRKAEDDNPLDPACWGQDAITLAAPDGAPLDTIAPTWEDLKRCLVRYGARNSLLLALMPTASTAQIMQNCESVEAHMTNYYTRFVLKGDFSVVNRYLLADLEELGLWGDATLNFLLVTKGSVQGLHKYVRACPHLFPAWKASPASWERLARVEAKFKTMWEIPQKVFLQMAARRGRYIDQSQSTNIYIRDCSDKQLEALHSAMDMLGLKTFYYLRTNPISSNHGTVGAAVQSEIQRALGMSDSAPGSAPEVEPPAAPETTPEVVPSAKPKIICTDEVCHLCCS